MNLFEGRMMKPVMTFTQAQLDEHVRLARLAFKAEAVRTLQAYAEGCREQALALGVGLETEHLRGAMETCLFMSVVIDGME